MRTIKFRGKASHNKDMWLYGDLIKINNSYHILGKDDMREDGHHITQDSDIPTWVDEETICQFTGMLDKNGNEIYEGDIVEFYCEDSYCINPDCEAHLLAYGTCIRKKIEIVKFEDCVFGIMSEFEIMALSYCGFSSEQIDELIQREKENDYFVTNGLKIDSSIMGVKIIGNIYDNPELIKGE